MSKTIKTITLIVCVFIALVIAALLLLPKLLNSDTFKQQLIQQVERHTGQTLTITGDVKLSLFPWLSVHTGAISLSQPAGISPTSAEIKKPLLQIESAKIGVKLLPLFKNKFELSKIELNQPQLYFIATKDGSTSLTGLNNNKPSNNSPDKPSTAKPLLDDKASTLGAIAISGISIINGDLVYEDQAQKTLYQLSKLDIEAGDILSLKPTPIKISAQVSANSNTDNKANSENIETFMIEIQSQVSHSADFLSATLAQVTANIIEINDSQSVPARKLNAKINTLRFNQKTQALDIEQLHLLINNGTLAPELSIPSVALSLNEYTTSIIAFNLDEKSLALKTRGEISVKDWNKEALFKGYIESDTFSPKRIVDFLEVDYKPTDKNVLNASKFSSEFTGSAHGIAIQNIKLTLDDSSLAGDLSLINFQNPSYRFDLDLDQIDIDRYMPQSEESSSKAQPVKNSQENKTTGLAIIAPLSLFKNISANGMFRITNLQASGAKLSNIVVDVKSKNKEVVIKPTADLYDGNMYGILTFKDKGNNSTLRVENNLQTVNFGPLLKDMKMTEKISGKGSAQTDIMFIEKNGQQTNDGKIIVSVSDGAFADIDVKKILDDAQNNIDSIRGKETKPQTAEKSETRFAQMNATLILKDNVITNNDLNIKAPAFRVGGKGEINLIPQTLEYATSVIVVNTNEGQGGKNRSDLQGLTIPVRFYGALSNPEYKIDFRALLKENTKRELADKKDELRQKAAEKLGLIKKGEQGTGDNGEITKKDLEKQLKEKAVEELFKKLF